MGKRNVPITPRMQEAVKLAAEGMSFQGIADTLHVDRSTVSRWFNREDVKTLRTAALAEVVNTMIPRAYAVLHDQLNHANPWVAQNAARELIRLYNVQQGAADANVAVIFGSMPKPGAPGSAGQLEENAPIDTDFSE